MVKYNQRLQNVIDKLAGQVGAAQAAAAAANVTAANAQAVFTVFQAAGTSEDSFMKSRDPNGPERGAASQNRRSRVNFVTPGNRSGRPLVHVLNPVLLVSRSGPKL